MASLAAFSRLATAAIAATGLGAAAAAQEPPVRLMTLDPGHFHAALVQKFMYPQVSPTVHVYSPGGADLDLHLQRIDGYNARADQPTRWRTTVYTGPDFFGKMLADRPGNVVVISGNNAKKTAYILQCVEAGLHVLADKPMAITPQDFDCLQKAFAVAREKKVLLWDVMTERFEITSQLQRALAQQPALFGRQLPGTPERPALTKESVHHYFKRVSGKPLIRPPWFFDVNQQGEGIADVTTHLVDLIQWELFPDTALNPGDVKVLSARRWTTPVSPADFARATGQAEFPAYLKPRVNAAGDLEVYCNGEFTYELRGVVCKVSVAWNFQAPEGAGDTHRSILRGSHTALAIRQGAEQGNKPTLFIEPEGLRGEPLARHVAEAMAALQAQFPGVAAEPAGEAFKVVIPAKYQVGHEAHFAQVTASFLSALSAGKLPDWEVPNILVKHHTIMQAYRMSR